MTFDFDTEIKHHLDVIRTMQKPSGVFTTSAFDVDTGYDKAWLRDIYFIVLSFLETGDTATVQTAAKALRVFVKHAEKINWAAEHRPHYTCDASMHGSTQKRSKNTGKNGNSQTTPWVRC